MTGPLRLLLAGSVALLVPLLALRQCAGPSLEGAQQRHNQEYETFVAEADRRNHFIRGLQGAQDVMMWVGDYYHHNWELPPSIMDLRHGLPEPTDEGPTAYGYDPADGAITLFFEGREGVSNGQVGFSLSVDDENKKLKWDCWTSDYPDIVSMLPSCEYVAP